MTGDQTFETLFDAIHASYKDGLIPFEVAFLSMLFCVFEAGYINEISEIVDLNNFPLLCGTDQLQGFEVQDLPMTNTKCKVFFLFFRKFINR